MLPYLLDWFSFLHLNDWMDMLTFVVFLLSIHQAISHDSVLLYYSSHSASTQVQSPPETAGLKHQTLPLAVLFLIRYIAAIVRKKDGNDAHCSSSCYVVNS